MNDVIADNRRLEEEKVNDNHYLNDEYDSEDSDYEPIDNPVVRLEELDTFNIDPDVWIDGIKMMTYINKIHRGKGTQRMIDYVKSCNYKLEKDREEFIAVLVEE